LNYKLLCIDMDGTLLNDNKEISERNREALKKAQERKVKVVISTGRLFTSAYYYADLIGIKAPIISANGAFIREKDRNEVIYKSLLGKENCEKVLKVLREQGLIPNFHTSEAIYTEKSNQHIQMYMKANDRYPENKRVKIEFVEDWSRVFEENKDEILKCLTIENDIKKVQRAKEEIIKLGILEVVSSATNNFEVMCKGVSKGRGVEILAAYYNIPREEVICIGDNENDLSMIEYAGLGIAMGNADEDTKAAAQYITGTNNESGVAMAIEKFILK
jgi:HAD-superfamily hydrolase, subfamily IIB